ncbi:hypothetical protein ECFDA507_2465, partial [Escherichia coli FDA507]
PSSCFCIVINRSLRMK